LILGHGFSLGSRVRAESGGSPSACPKDARVPIYVNGIHGILDVNCDSAQI
jgi:hypothetical protein